MYLNPGPIQNEVAIELIVCKQSKLLRRIACNPKLYYLSLKGPFQSMTQCHESKMMKGKEKSMRVRESVCEELASACSFFSFPATVHPRFAAGNLELLRSPTHSDTAMRCKKPARHAAPGRFLVTAAPSQILLNSSRGGSFVCPVRFPATTNSCPPPFLPLPPPVAARRQR